MSPSPSLPGQIARQGLLNLGSSHLVSCIGRRIGLNQWNCLWRGICLWISKDTVGGPYCDRY